MFLKNSWKPPCKGWKFNSERTGSTLAEAKRKRTREFKVRHANAALINLSFRARRLTVVSNAFKPFPRTRPPLPRAHRQEFWLLRSRRERYVGSILLTWRSELARGNYSAFLLSRDRRLLDDLSKNFSGAGRCHRVEIEWDSLRRNCVDCMCCARVRIHDGRA